MVFKEKEWNSKDVKSDICKVVNAEKCDFLFMGSFGRKGSQLAY